MSSCHELTAIIDSITRSAGNQSPDLCLYHSRQHCVSDCLHRCGCNMSIIDTSSFFPQDNTQYDREMDLVLYRSFTQSVWQRNGLGIILRSFTHSVWQRNGLGIILRSFTHTCTQYRNRNRFGITCTYKLYLKVLSHARTQYKQPWKCSWDL